MAFFNNIMQKTLFERLLDYFKISEADYADLIAPVSIESFSAGHQFERMSEAVEIVKAAVDNKDKIFIYGDYDADGIMSTSIVVKSLLKLGVIPSFYIPNRYKDGYGITLSKAEEIVSEGVKLVITVDNGISANEPIAYLHEKGVKVVVLDHHTVPSNVPVADVIIHPTYSKFGTIATSAGFVSFMFSWALLGYFDKYLSCLAAISVISDMMPLLDYNRRFLRLVFNSYQDGEFYAIDLLKESGPFDENAIGMRIAPQINALGRLLDDESINYIIHYFVTSDKDKINRLFAWINSNNEKRKEESRMASVNAPEINENDPAIIVLTDVKEGLLGLIANQLCSEYRRPVIVFDRAQEEGILKGSCRAPEGFNVVDAFNSCGDIMITSGGHALAGGCSIHEKDFEQFKNLFLKYVEQNPIVVVDHHEIVMGLTEINEENYQLINSFAPFGESWKMPSFLIKHIKTDSLMFSRTGEHILTYVGQGVKLTGFGFGKEMVQSYNYIDLIGQLRSSVYRGNRSLDFVIKEIRESGK